MHLNKIREATPSGNIFFIGCALFSLISVFGIWLCHRAVRGIGGAPFFVPLLGFSKIHKQQRIKMKILNRLILLGLITLLFNSCRNENDKSISLDYRSAFVVAKDKYLFIQDSVVIGNLSKQYIAAKVNDGDDIADKIYVLMQDEDSWVEVLSLNNLSDIDDMQFVRLQNRDYFFYQYYSGGSQWGEFFFNLFELKAKEAYSLNISGFHVDGYNDINYTPKNLVNNKPLLDYLDQKVKAAKAKDLL